ncbi:hypothetical protein PQR67_11200 [Paraburkholderia fungorum]|uniref:hypothetical protein n=1 Tax=Paraburkholderia fungorum TaxID=134537 RepID=UPI0038BE0A2C
MRNILAPHRKACQCLFPILPQCDSFLIIVFPVWQIALLGHGFIGTDENGKTSHTARSYFNLSVRTQTLSATDLRMRDEFRQRSKITCRASE